MKLFKNGSPSQVQAKVPAKVPPEKLKDYVGGKESADRLLASELDKDYAGPYQIRDTSIGYIVKDRNGVQVEKPYKKRADAENAVKTMEGWGQHVLTDLSIDKRWPTIEYGQFDKSKTVTPNTAKEIADFQDAVYDSADPADVFYDDALIAKVGISKKDIKNANKYWEDENEKYEDLAIELHDRIVKWIMDNPTDSVSLPYTDGLVAILPKTEIAKDATYLPGKIAQTLKRLTGGDIEMVEVGGKAISSKEELANSQGAGMSGRWYDLEGNLVPRRRAEVLIANGESVYTGPSESIGKKPFLRFTKDTPKTFSIYEWAAMTGLSAAIIKQYLDQTDENKRKMLGKFPALGMIN